jgi:hypothetical protein
MRAHYPGIHIVRSKFTPDEDARLRAIVAEKGTADWALIADLMPQRDSRQCKERWFHYLSPNLADRPWTKAEDAILEAKVAECGHKWKLFEAFFPGRVDISIKNRFNLLFRRRRRNVRLVMQSLVSGKQTPKKADIGDPSEISACQEAWDMFAQEDFEWTPA